MSKRSEARAGWTDLVTTRERFASFAPTVNPPSKYRNVKTNGYASKREATRAAELALLLQSREISQLVEQPEFLLIPKQDGERACHYVADFEYRTKTGERVVEDCKGVRTAEYIIKRKLMLFVHGIHVKEV